MFNTKTLHNNYFFLHYELLPLYHLGQKNKLKFPLRLIYYYCWRYGFVSECTQYFQECIAKILLGGVKVKGGGKG